MANFRGATPSTAKVMSAYMQNLEAIFDPSCEKLWGIPSPMRCALARHGHSV